MILVILTFLAVFSNHIPRGGEKHVAIFDWASGIIRVVHRIGGELVGGEGGFLLALEDVLAFQDGEDAGININNI